MSAYGPGVNSSGVVCLFMKGGYTSLQPISGGLRCPVASFGYVEPDVPGFPLGVGLGGVCTGGFQPNFRGRVMLRIASGVFLTS